MVAREPVQNILITLRIHVPAHRCIPGLQLLPAPSGGIEHYNRISEDWPQVSKHTLFTNDELTICRQAWT